LVIREYKESYYPANESWNWTLFDNKENFNKNLSNKSLKYYKENPIEYSFNNYGFRTPDDFPDTERIHPQRWSERQAYGNVFLGCSHTMGVGHHLENTWSYKLNKHIGGKFWNLSQGGCGIQTDYRLILAWKDTLKIKNIFHYTVPWPRFEFFNGKEVIGLNHQRHNVRWKYKQFRWDFYLDVLSGEEYCNYNQMVYINAIKGLSHDIGCNYYYLTDKILKKFDENDNSIPARDLGHYSTGKQNFIYEEFKKL
jgi:hypothetical protein